jgi:DNA polymerase III alpha subunit
MSSVALTDHGHAGGLLQFSKACIKENVKPIYGIELYCAPESRFSKEKIDGHVKTSYHLTVLAKNKTGLENLFELTSKGYIEGFYYKPRVDMKLLKELSEGLVVLSGCGSGRLSAYLMENRFEEAIEHVKELREIWGDNLYMEMQNHLLDWQIPLNTGLRIISEELDIPLVVTQDSHYPTRKDSELHNYICKLTAGDLTFDSDHSWFKSYDEICEMFDEEDYHAIHRTQEVAEKCVFDWEYGKTIWPVYDLPEGKTIEEEFNEQSRAGFAKKFPEPTEEYKERLEFELKMIKQMGFPSYFLVVADFIRWAKTQGIPVGPGRGSAAGSLVAYSLEITNIDPIKYGLYFERFINPSRISLPDIDVDICKKRRSEVIQYVANKYGTNKIAQIGTYAVFKPRGSLRAFARVCGYEQSVGHKLANMVPPDIAGKSLKFDKVIETTPELLKAGYNDVVSLARKAEGLRNQAGVHAAGVVISDSDICRQVPLMVGKSGEICTQFDMYDIEDIGLVKFDFLGLKNLTVIAETIKMVEVNHNTNIDINNIEDKNPEVYSNIFSKGILDGVFQFEGSSGFKDLCIKVKPDNIEDLAAITSLFRPGPLSSGYTEQYVDCKNGKNPEYLVSGLEPILRNTYGTMVYQEQIMRICTDIAGYTLSEADNMRKIIGKKIADKMKLEHGKFVDGCVKNDIKKEHAEQMFEAIVGFAAYGFNKCISGRERFLRVGHCKTGKSIYCPTIEEMYKIKNNRDYAKSIGKLPLHDKYKYLGYGSGFSLGKDGKLYRNKIVDIHDQGIRSVVKITLENGKHITTTTNHKFPTTNGEKLVSKIDIEKDFLYVNNGYTQEDTAYRFTNKGKLNDSRYHSNNLVEKYELNSQKGKMGFQQRNTSYTKLNKYKKALQCESPDCKGTFKRLEIHHLDNNHANNTDSNIATYCASCHKKAHYKMGRTTMGQKGLSTQAISIVSIETSEPEAVYDVEMAAPNHSFVIQNGIVTCNSHAVAYSVISYQTAWLKHYYPHEFYTALQNESLDKPNDMVRYIHAAKKQNIDLLPPDINTSDIGFALDAGTIIFGLAGIKGLGEKACKHLMQMRKEHGEFDSLNDLIRKKIKQDVVKALAECGALESITEYSRNQIVENIQPLMDHFKKLENWNEQIRKREINKQERLQAVEEGKKPPRVYSYPKSDTPPEPPEIPKDIPLEKHERLELERKTLGFYLTGHPLDDYPGILKMAKYNISNILEGCTYNSEKVSIPVVISTITQKRSRKQTNYAILKMEDQTGRIEGTMFSRSWEKLKDQLEEGTINIVHMTTRKVIVDEEAPPIINISVNYVKPIKEDSRIKVSIIELNLLDGTLVQFNPQKEQDIYKWQKAMAYINNLKRMGCR